MKRILTIVMALAVVSVFTAAQAQQFISDAKVGTAYAKDAHRFGFNSALEVGVGVNPYFELLAMPGFTWFNWENGTGNYKAVGAMTAEIKKTNDAFMFPILAGAKIKIADLKESIGIVPYVTLGAGYTWMGVSSNTPAYTDTDTSLAVPKSSSNDLFRGFTAIALLGASYTMADTGMSIIAEGGYRYSKLRRNGLTLDMSGFAANIGVSFAIGEE